jgi:hypothetical protein
MKTKFFALLLLAAINTALVTGCAARRHGPPHPPGHMQVAP